MLYKDQAFKPSKDQRGDIGEMEEKERKEKDEENKLGQRITLLQI